jgi:myosin heavy subunit
LNSSPTVKNKESNIEKTIILSTPILEAFGNSKTIRNNNSSRFGKYLSIWVDSKSRSIKNAEIYNYLLEKSRIISRSREEQNFHVFYEFLLKTTPEEKNQYCLVDP